MNTAKLIRLELISDPEQAVPATDRAGWSTLSIISVRPIPTASWCCEPLDQSFIAIRSTRLAPITGPDV